MSVDIPDEDLRRLNEGMEKLFERAADSSGMDRAQKFRLQDIMLDISKIAIAIADRVEADQAFFVQVPAGLRAINGLVEEFRGIIVEAIIEKDPSAIFSAMEIAKRQRERSR